jgi:hypothetical protein
LPIVGEKTSRFLPLAASTPKAVAPREDRARGLDVLLVEPRTNRRTGHEVHGVTRPGDEAVQGHQEVEQHLACCDLWLDVIHHYLLGFWAACAHGRCPYLWLRERPLG